MCWFVLGTTILLFILSIYIFPHKLINVNTFFLGLWSIIIFLSCLNLYGLNKPSDMTYILLFFMIASFFCGSIFGVILPTFNCKIKMFNHKREIRIRVFIGLTIVMFVSLFISCGKFVRYVIDGVPLWQIRNWNLSAYGTNNPSSRTFISQCIKVFVITPFSSVFCPFVAYYFLDPRKNEYRGILFVISIIYVLVSSMTSGGGGSELYVIVYILY